MKNSRFSVALPPKSNDALDDLVATTGLSKNELIRQAVNLLTISKVTNDKGLSLAIVDDDKVLRQLISTL